MAQPDSIPAPIADPVLSDRSIRLVGIAALAYGVVPYLGDLGLVLVGPASTDAHRAWAVVVVAAFLPLHVRHIWYAVHGQRSPHGGWTLAAMAAVLAVALPLVGYQSVRFWTALIASTVIVLGPRLGAVPALALSLLAYPATVAFGAHGGIYSWANAVLNSFLPAWRALILYVLVWLAAALRTLHAARSTLAREAVALERRRVDDQAQGRLDRALAEVVNVGERVLASPWSDPVAVRAEAAALPGVARTALAETRALIQGYRHPSLAAEVATAAALLKAAGVDAAVTALPPHLSTAATQTAREEIRQVTTALLGNPDIQPCVLEVDASGHVTVEPAARRVATA